MHERIARWRKIAATALRRLAYRLDPYMAGVPRKRCKAEVVPSLLGENKENECPS